MYRIFYYSFGEYCATYETYPSKIQAKKRCEYLNNPENVIQGLGWYIYKREN